MERVGEKWKPLKILKKREKSIPGLSVWKLRPGYGFSRYVRLALNLTGAAVSPLHVENVLTENLLLLPTSSNP